MPGISFSHKGAIYRVHVQAPDPLDCVDHWLDELLGEDAELKALVAVAQTDEQILAKLLPVGSPPPAEPAGRWLYGDMAGLKAKEPFVRVWLEASENVKHTGTEFVAALHYGIAGVARGASYAALSPINSRIHELVGSASQVERDDGVINSCQLLRLWRESEV